MHPNGITVPELDAIYSNQTRHDPTDLDGARALAEDGGAIRLGLFYRNEHLPCYDEIRRVPSLTAAERVTALNEELDRYAV